MMPLEEDQIEEDDVTARTLRIPVIYERMKWRKQT